MPPTRDHGSHRPPAVAGTWYPASAAVLAKEVDAHLAAAEVPPGGRVDAVIAPHAGLMFSGGVGAYAYKAAASGSRSGSYDVAFVLGPSHFVSFDGIAVWPAGAFDSPLGPAVVDESAASRILADPVAHVTPRAHAREHSVEMQLPFLRRLFPEMPIVPMLMGFQRRETIDAAAAAIARAAHGRRALLIASTDLSHFFDAARAAALDAHVQEFVRAFDPEGLLDLFEQYPEHERGRHVACGGGPAIAVMKAARALGATSGRVLKYGHSGHVSGDHERVVGYLAAAFGGVANAH